MNGTAHATIGAASGFMIANTLHTDPSTTITLIGLGGISGLVPDLDIDGKLSGRITLSHTMIRIAAQLIGIMMIFYSFYLELGIEKYFGVGIGIIIVGIASSIKQKHMLTITGIGVLIGGLTLEESWITLMGLYIIIASLISHRTYTHSIIGVIFFALIASKLENSLGIPGVYYTCLIGYISHLVADSKLIPFNKRGIKLLLPLSSKEF